MLLLKEEGMQGRPNQQMSTKTLKGSVTPGKLLNLSDPRVSPFRMSVLVPATRELTNTKCASSTASRHRM